MKNYQKIILYILLIIILLAGILLTNKYTQKCSLGHQYNNETNLCSYNTIIGMSDCSSGMIYEEGKCLYKREGFFTKNLVTILIISGISILLFIVIYILVIRKKKLGDIAEAIRIPMDWEEEVKPAFEEHWAKSFNITLVDNKTPENTFFYIEREPFVHSASGRRYMQIEMQCYTAQNPDGNGIFTLILPMDKEKKEEAKKVVWNEYRARRKTFDQYKFSHSRPLAISKRPDDIMRSLIAGADSPEEALQKVQAYKQMSSAFETPKEAPEPVQQQEPMPREELEQLDPYERMKYEQELGQGRQPYRRKQPIRRPFRR